MEMHKVTVFGEQDDAPRDAVYCPAVSPDAAILANFRLVTMDEHVRMRRRERPVEAVRLERGTPVVLATGATGVVRQAVGDWVHVELDDGEWKLNVPIGEVHCRMSDASGLTVDDLPRLVEAHGHRTHEHEGVHYLVPAMPARETTLAAPPPVPAPETTPPEPPPVPTPETTLAAPLEPPPAMEYSARTLTPGAHALALSFTDDDEANLDRMRHHGPTGYRHVTRDTRKGAPIFYAYCDLRSKGAGQYRSRQFDHARDAALDAIRYLRAQLAGAPDIDTPDAQDNDTPDSQDNDTPDAPDAQGADAQGADSQGADAPDSHGADAPDSQDVDMPDAPDSQGTDAPAAGLTAGMHELALALTGSSSRP